MARANLKMECALRLKDEFLASMGRELRTPLTGILGLSEALRYNTCGELGPKQRSIIAHMLEDFLNANNTKFSPR